MENASKALIIAGAILISILLISVAIMVMNSTSGVTDQVEGNMDALAIQQFNAKFDGYAGTSQSATSVKGLLSAVIASNATSSHQITISVTANSGLNGSTAKSSSTAADLSTFMGNLKSNMVYKVTITTGSDGYDSTVTIDKG